MGKYRGYEKYKDTGVEWLGDIPEHWATMKIQHVGRLKSGENIVSQQIEKEGLYPVFGGNGLRGYFDLYTHDGHYILIGRQGALCGNINYGNGRFWASGHAVVVLPSVKYHVCWLGGLLETMNLNQYSTSAAQPGLSVEQIGRLKIPFPPLNEQESIAHFLDRKTSQIDALIAKKEALLEKLDEKRTALISHAVTKGLDPNVPMKDSGVEWLGEIPKHWIVSKARFASSIFVPQRNKPELNSDEGLPWVTMDDMSSERIKETLFKVSDIAFKIAGSKMLKKNSVIASCIGNFGICAINDVDVIINQQLQAFIPFSTIIPEYLCEIARISNDYFKMIATAATVVYVNQSGFANMPILLPPKEEQEEIVNFTVLKTTKIDQQKVKVKEAIALLKEYRTSLITNAVTGKIDVRQVSSP
jgi:type I restriction enzyme, S subunit